MHPRRIIREAAFQAILTGDTAAGDRVWASRVPPVNVEKVLIDEGPVALVYVRTDTIRPEDYPASGYDGPVKRTAELAVELTAAGADVVDDKLDDHAEQVEALLEELEIPGLPTAETRLISTEIEVTDEFEQAVGGALLTYEVTYWVPFRKDKTPGWLPEEVFGSAQRDPREQLVASDAN